MSSAYDPGGTLGNRNCPLSSVFVVNCPANQRRRADSDDRTRKDAALRVLDGSNEGSRQSLGER